MEWFLFIIALILGGIWTKHQNTKHFRKLANKCFEDHMHTSSFCPIPLYGKKLHINPSKYSRRWQGRK